MKSLLFYFSLLLLVMIGFSSCDKEELSCLCEGNHRDTIYIENHDTIYVHTTDTIIVSDKDEFYYRFKIVSEGKTFNDTISTSHPDIYNLQSQYPNRVDRYNNETDQFETVGLWRQEWYCLSSINYRNEFYEDKVIPYNYREDFPTVIDMGSGIMGPVKQGYEIRITMLADHVYGSYYESWSSATCYVQGTIETNCIPQHIYKISLEVSKNHEPFTLVKEAYGEIVYSIE